MFADAAEVFAAVFSALTVLSGHHQRDCYAASVTTRSRYDIRDHCQRQTAINKNLLSSRSYLKCPIDTEDWLLCEFGLNIRCGCGVRNDHIGRPALGLQDPSALPSSPVIGKKDLR
jgi:hypothetical protein